MTANTICRLCLSTQGVMEDIFSSSDPDLHKRIFECTNIEIKNFPGLPSCICDICKSELQTSYKFRQQCFKSHMLLKTIFPELFKDAYPEGFVKSYQVKHENCMPIEDPEEQIYSTIEVYYNDENVLSKREKEENDEVSLLKIETVKEEYNEESNGNEIASEQKEIKINELVLPENLFTPDETGSTYNDDYWNHEIEENIHELEKPLFESETIKKDYNEGSSENKVMLESGTNLERRENQITKVIADECNNDNLKQVIDENNHELEISHSKSGVIKESSENQITSENNLDPEIGEDQTMIVTSDGNFVLKMSDSNHLRYQYQSSCPVCGKMTTKLKRHMLLHKQDKKPFKCKQCGQGFRYNFSLQHHIFTHTGEKPYKCKLCGRGFARRFSLHRHVNTHKGRGRFRCKLCDQSFAQATNLAAHKKNHSEEKSYKREYCGKRFTQKYPLTEHLRTYTGRKSNKCNK